MEYLNYAKGTGELENWLIEETCFDSRFLGKCEAIFAQGNGYLGLRAATEERYTKETRDMFVTGTFNCYAPNEVTELPNLPDITQLELRIDGRPFSLETGTVREYSRICNLKTGELVRRLRWVSPEGKELELAFERIVSLKCEHLIASRVTIRPLQPIHLEIESGIDGRVTNGGSQHFMEGEKRLYDQTCLEMLSRTNQSGVYAAIHAVHRILLDGEPWKCRMLPVIDRRLISCRYTGEVPAGKTLQVEKISTVHTSRDLWCEDLRGAELLRRLKEDGRKACVAAAGAGYEALAAESAAVWAQFWEESDVQIDSSRPLDQLAIRFALYHLNIMVKRDDSRVGIGAKGLSGEGYKGHSFWDTETFIFPYFLFTAPDTARTLLEYRYRSLVGARKKAREYGLEGAMYPWESAWIDDGEVTPLWGAADVVTGETLPILTGKLEIHISADIACAVDLYHRVTGDDAFMEECGYEIILDTARFWLSRFTWNEEKNYYELTDVIGPDEYKEHVDNNAYTNYMAAFNIRLAGGILKKLKADKPQIYRRLEEKLRLPELEKNLDKAKLLYCPQPDESGIIPQFDGYFSLEHVDLRKYKESSVVGTIYEDYNMDQINRLQVSKQGDTVVLLELLGDAFPPEIRRKNFVYYEERTLHDSSLSRSTHCVLAADLGMEEMAYHFFTGAAAVDLSQEMHSSDMGIHSASMGGIWQAAVYGFGGLRMEKEGLRICPRLPRGWKRMAYSIFYRGVRLKIEADRERVTVTADDRIDGLLLCGQKTALEKGESRTFLQKERG